MSNYKDLIERCKEICAWQDTGLLKGDALRNFAASRPYAQQHNAVSIAQAETLREVADAFIASVDRIAELESRLEFNHEAPGIDGIYCRDETIRLQEARITELDSKVIACNSKLIESQGMADCMAMVRQEMIDAGVLSSVILPTFMPESIIPRLKALDAIRARLPDDLYSHSKDWSSGNLADRIEWLKIGYESQKSLVSDFMTQIDDIWKQSPIGEVTHSDVLPGDDGLYRHEFRSSERIGLQAELFARPGKVEAQEPVAWDVFERRIYGAPGETNHRVLWVEHYKRSDGTISSDLDYLLEAANPPGGISGGKTIHVRPLVYGD